MSHPSLILNAVFWVGFATVFAQFSEAIKNIFLARYFSTQQMGLITLLWAIHTGVRVFSDIGYESALIQQKDEQFEGAVHTSFVTSMLRGLLLCLLLLLSAGWIAEYYAQPQLKDLLIGSAFLFLLMGFKNLYFLSYHRAVQLKKPKLLTSLAHILDLCVTVIIALSFQSIWAVVCGAFAYHLVDVMGTFVLSEKRAKFYFDYQIFKQLIGFGKHIQMISILTYLITQLDRFVIAKAVAIDQVAIYGTAYFLANLPSTYIMQIANQIAYPLWSKAVRDGDLGLRNQMFMTTLKFTSLAAFLFAVIFYLMGESLIVLIYGQKWLPSYPILKILVFFGLIRAVASNFGILFKSIGRPDFITTEILLKLIAIVLCIYPLTLSFGIQGTAYAVTLPFLIITPFALNIYLKLADLKPITMLKALLIPTLCALVIMLLIFLLRQVDIKHWLWQTSITQGLLLPVFLLFFGLVLGITLDEDLRSNPILSKLLLWKRANP
jgi:O-antigen/teichoic acid export membrane protein